MSDQQKSLFTYICSDEGHNFQPLETDGGRGYYKRDENGVAVKDKVYKMTLCPKCGETKEIVVRDNEVKQELIAVKKSRRRR
jgi:Zn finger protein HypA/HybF involved in hydrogenase expression